MNLYLKNLLTYLSVAIFAILPAPITLSSVVLATQDIYRPNKIPEYTGIPDFITRFSQMYGYWPLWTGSILLAFRAVIYTFIQTLFSKLLTSDQKLAENKTRKLFKEISLSFLSESITMLIVYPLDVVYSVVCADVAIGNFNGFYDVYKEILKKFGFEGFYYFFLDGFLYNVLTNAGGFSIAKCIGSALEGTKMTGASLSGITVFILSFGTQGWYNRNVHD
jgi:hypothetical protein